MKKMTTLFKVTYSGRDTVWAISSVVRPENSWVFTEEGVRATRKWDGTAIAFIEGVPYKRVDPKVGKKLPPDSIPCGEADIYTGSNPHWTPILKEDASNRWFYEALEDRIDAGLGYPTDGTYELCGEKVGGNKENLVRHKLIPHGEVLVPLLELSFAGICAALLVFDIEGIVFHGKEGKMCKIRKVDFGIRR